MNVKVKTVLKIILSSIAGPLILYGIFFIYLHYQTHVRHLFEKFSETCACGAPTTWFSGGQ